MRSAVDEGAYGSVLAKTSHERLMNVRCMFPWYVIVERFLSRGRIRLEGMGTDQQPRCSRARQGASAS